MEGGGRNRKLIQETMGAILSNGNCSDSINHNEIGNKPLVCRTLIFQTEFSRETRAFGRGCSYRSNDFEIFFYPRDYPMRQPIYM